MRFSPYLLLFLFANVSFSQSKYTLTEQEYQKLHDKSRLLLNSNVDSSFIIANKIEKSNNNLHKSFAYGIKSYLYRLKGDSIKSKEVYKKAFAYLDMLPVSNNKTKLNAYLLNYGGLIDWKNGNLSQALIKYEQGKKLSEKAKDIIQVVKFGTNISNIYGSSSNYKLAIQVATNTEKELDRYQYVIAKEQFENYKSNINSALGNFYENKYKVNEKQISLLDSAEVKYKKAIAFSKNFIDTKVIIQTNLGNIYSFRNKNKEAENIYNEVILASKYYSLSYAYYISNYNLGFLFFKQKKNQKSLLCFKKVDSIYTLNKTNPQEFYESNYYQAKIYNELNDSKKAVYHSQVFLKIYQENEFKLNSEKTIINSKISENNFEKEMLIIQEKNKQNELLSVVLKIFLALISVIVLILLFKNHKEKKEAIKKVKLLIEEFKNAETNRQEKKLIEANVVEIENVKDTTKSILSLDDDKEKLILEKLKTLVEKEAFLKEGFTQQYVANKIKTNTTYLSYVINKNFKKSFSEYSNELKINYAVNQMITNPTYRRYSTQAIAESVGFKNATSFTTSFKKRTGVTPVLFIKNLN